MTFVDDLQGAATRQVLDDVVTFVRRFIVLSSDAQATAIALWLAHTHAISAAEATPYLHVTSAEKASGKSRLLELLAALARDGVHVANISEAALFRMLDAGPTLLIDEVDALFASNGERTEGLRGVINAGNRRGAVVYRCEGPRSEARPFEVFAPKVLAGIDTGRLPDTIADRSVTLRMQRKLTSERVERLLWQRVRPEVEALRGRLAEWAGTAVDRLSASEPELPTQLDDRAAEAWWALLAIADLAGGDWPRRARAAAVELHAGGEEDGDSHRARVLGVLRRVLGSRAAVATTELVDALNGDEELPYGGWRDGKGIDARGVARFLKPYGLSPRTVRLDDGTVKGYARDGDLEDAFARYVQEPSHGSRASQPAPEAQSNNGRVTGVTDVTHVTDVTDVTDVTADVEEVDPELEARAERMRADFLADAGHAVPCRCERPVRAVDEDGAGHCARCGRGVA